MRRTKAVTCSRPNWSRCSTSSARLSPDPPAEGRRCRCRSCDNRTPSSAGSCRAGPHAPLLPGTYAVPYRPLSGAGDGLQTPFGGFQDLRDLGRGLEQARRELRQSFLGQPWRRAGDVDRPGDLTGDEDGCGHGSDTQGVGVDGDGEAVVAGLRELGADLVDRLGCAGPAVLPAGDALTQD